MVTIREYVKPENLEEAWQLNQKRQNRIIAGMLWTKMSRGNIHTAIDLSGLCLDEIRETEEEFSIGCMATLRQIELHQGLNAYTGGAVREAVRHIVGVQFRNLATVGGSIYGRYGFSDVLTIFLAMDSYVKLYKGGILPLEEYAAMPYDRDILEAVLVKKTPAKYVYQSIRNTKTDFPVLAVAGGKSLQEGNLWLSVGARPKRAVLVKDEKKLLSGGVTEESMKAFVEYVRASVKTGSNLRGSAEYRTHLAGVLAERIIRKLEGGTI